MPLWFLGHDFPIRGLKPKFGFFMPPFVDIVRLAQNSPTLWTHFLQLCRSDVVMVSAPPF